MNELKDRQFGALSMRSTKQRHSRTVEQRQQTIMECPPFIPSLRHHFGLPVRPAVRFKQVEILRKAISGLSPVKTPSRIWSYTMERLRDNGARTDRQVASDLIQTLSDLFHLHHSSPNPLFVPLIHSLSFFSLGHYPQSFLASINSQLIPFKSSLLSLIFFLSPLPTSKTSVNP